MTSSGRTGDAGIPGHTAGVTSHYPSLDGLRAIAVIGVMSLHYLVRAPVLPTVVGSLMHEFEANGEYGVDLFFVLSGFLITGILLATRESPTYFRTFYTRRVLRIFPLYYAALLALLILVPMIAPNTFGVPKPDLMSPAWFWLYVANWPIAIHGWAVSPPALPHFWTLAIEEQFYLIWPAVVFLAPKRRLAVCCTMLVALGIALRFLLVTRWPALTVIDVATLTRVDGLAIGALVAVWWSSPGAVARVKQRVWPAFWTLLAAIIAVRLWRGRLDLDDHFVLVAGLPLITAFFGTMVAAALLRDAAALSAGWLSAAPLRFLGRHSYAMYVLHYPILIALNHAGITVPELVPRLHSRAVAEAALFLLNAGCTIAGAMVTWRLIEQPMLRLKERFPYLGRTPEPAVGSVVLPGEPA